MGFANFAKGQISNAFMPTYGFVYGGKYRNAWVALPWKHFSPQKDLAAVVNDPTTDPHSADTIEFWAQFKPGSDGVREWFLAGFLELSLWVGRFSQRKRFSSFKDGHGGGLCLRQAEHDDYLDSSSRQRQDWHRGGDCLL